MILRSVAKNLGGKDALRRFRTRAFEMVESPIDLMDRRRLTRDSVLASIRTLCGEFPLSFGQAQKPINAVLKYHFYLTRPGDEQQEAVLDCPLDSLVLEELGVRSQPLSRMDEAEYLEMRNKIRVCCPIAVRFDKVWGKRYLRAAGITWHELDS